jgi:hypothetical protein
VLRSSRIFGKCQISSDETILICIKQHVFEPLKTCHPLRLLHIRQSGLDLWAETSWALKDVENDDHVLKFRHSFLAFGRWAFGPLGFPSLRVIAYGDFSYDGRYEDSQVLIGRNTVNESQGHRSDGQPYRVTTPKDDQYGGLIEKHMAALAACPSGPLML